MKQLIFLVALVHLLVPGHTQVKPFNGKPTDSIPVVQLEEVKVYGLTKNTSQQLLNYYTANQAATTEDILARLPELNMIRRSSYGMEPVIRTYSSGQSDLLIDGMRIHGACTDKMDPASIYVEPQNLQSVQIQTGHGFQSGSVIGGSVDLKLAEAIFEDSRRWSGSVSSGFQSAANAWYETGKLNYAGHRLAVMTNISWRKAGNYRSGGGARIPYSQYEKLNYGITALYKLNPRWTAKADLLLDDGWNIGYPALPMDVGYAGARIAALSLRNTSRMGKWQQTELKIYANSIRHFMDDSHRINVPMHMDMPGESRTYGGYASSKLIINRSWHLNLKADIASTFLKASMTMYQPGQLPMYMLTWPDNSTLQSGLGIVFSKRIDSASVFTLSTRVDLFRKVLTSQVAKDQLSVLNNPVNNINRVLKNIAVEYSCRFNEQLKIKTILSYSERMPTSSELYGFYLFNAFDGYDYIGNTLLKQENAWKAEANISGRSGIFQYGLTGYVSRINQYIMGIYQPGLSTMTIGANGVKQHVNLPYAMIAGVEASLIVQPDHSLWLINTTRYSYGEDHLKNALPMIPPVRNTSSLRKVIGPCAVQAELELATAQNRVSSMAMERKTSAYAIAHLRLMYSSTLAGNQFRIDGGVENLLDQAYREHLDWGGILRPGRNVYLQFTFQF
ncbi:MAG TPA: TonB-dependent receptor [Sediminibacterium sp.]|nr:TonB-dependent receptor [Sediminibacterium sp.]